MKLLSEVKSDGDPELIGWYNHDYNSHVFGFQIYACIIIFGIAILIPFTLMGGVEFHKSVWIQTTIYVILFVLPILTACVLEVVAY